MIFSRCPPPITRCAFLDEVLSLDIDLTYFMPRRQTQGARSRFLLLPHNLLAAFIMDDDAASVITFITGDIAFLVAQLMIEHAATRVAQEYTKMACHTFGFADGRDDS